jgi:hypothetical protein
VTIGSGCARHCPSLRATYYTSCTKSVVASPDWRQDYLEREQVAGSVGWLDKTSKSTDSQTQVLAGPKLCH